MPEDKLIVIRNNRRSMIRRKLNSLWKLLVKNKITKPCTMGTKLLILATAPCVKNYFEKESVRQQFKDYDIACINYMLYYSKKEVFQIKPKYFVLMDPCFYQEYVVSPNEPPIPSYKEIAKILEEVDWDCYIVTTVFADFAIKNPHVHYIRLSCFSTTYKKWKLPILKANYVNLGYYNVIQGALFFAIVFGYKDVAMMGCPYKPLNTSMTEEGLHVVEHMHYYDTSPYEYTIPYEELHSREEGFFMRLNRRGYLSSRCLWDIKKLADNQGCNILNYSEDSRIDAFRVGKLQL